MTSDSQSKYDRHRSPIRFSLSTFLFLMTGICLLLGYRAATRVAHVETSFDLRSHLLRSFGPAPRRSIEFMSRTHFVEPTDDLIINEVVSDPHLKNMMVIHGHADPAAWLKESLVWHIDADAEDLHMRLTVPRSQKRMAREVFVSIFRAFLKNAKVDDSVICDIKALQRNGH